MRADSDSWKHLPVPSQLEPLGLDTHFTAEEFARLEEGLIPVQMEDKWFVYYADAWLRFHRTWTGAYIYGIRLEVSANGARIIDSWVNRDTSQYKLADLAYDRTLVRFLIDAFLLKKDGLSFPMPKEFSDAPPGVIQHSTIGRAFPERPYDE